MSLYCANCEYEVDELNNIKLCQTCANAYDMGLIDGRNGY